MSSHLPILLSKAEADAVVGLAVTVYPEWSLQPDQKQILKRIRSKWPELFDSYKRLSNHLDGAD